MLESLAQHATTDYGADSTQRAPIGRNIPNQRKEPLDLPALNGNACAMILASSEVCHTLKRECGVGFPLGHGMGRLRTFREPNLSFSLEDDVRHRTVKDFVWI